MLTPNPDATARTRYDRLARCSGRFAQRSERPFAPWRALLWSRVGGPRVLEVGVGTGRNMPGYPRGMAITAVDLSPRMLARARARAAAADVPVTLREADIQALPFPDASFDTVVGSFVFCSVPDPLVGLREIERVLVPGGQLLLLEHVLSAHTLLAPLMHLANPLVVRIMGANINRATIANVARAGFVTIAVQTLWLDIVTLIEARPGAVAR